MTHGFQSTICRADLTGPKAFRRWAWLFCRTSAAGVTKLCPPLYERVLAQRHLLSPRFQGMCGRERPPGVPPTWLDRIGVPGGPALPHVSRKNSETPTKIRPYHSRHSAVTKFGHTHRRLARRGLVGYTFPQPNTSRMTCARRAGSSALFLPRTERPPSCISSTGSS